MMLACVDAHGTVHQTNMSCNLLWELHTYTHCHTVATRVPYRLDRVLSNNPSKTILTGSSTSQTIAGTKGQRDKAAERCTHLSPCSRQVHRVSLVACWLGASPPDITGLISSMKTSHSSYCQKLYTACTPHAPSQLQYGVYRSSTPEILSE